MALIRPQQFYESRLTRSLTLGGSETEVYVETLPTETTGSMVINPRSEDSREKITYTGTSTSPNRLTGVTRGIPFATTTGSATSTSRTAANCKRHTAGEAIEMNPGHYESLMADILGGTSAMSNVLQMGSNKITGVATPTANTDVAIKSYVDGVAIAGAPDANATTKGIVEQATAAEVLAGTDTGGTTAPLFPLPSSVAAAVQKGSWIYATEDGTGSDDTYTWATTPVTTAYTTGSIRLVTFTIANTGACTGNENSLGAKNLKKYAAGAKADLATGDIVANMACLLYYDGTDLVLLNPNANYPTTAIMDEMNTFFGSTDITASEAETLTAGTTSDAASLHKHSTVKAHVFDRNQTANTSEQTIISYTVPANRLGTKSGILVKFSIPTFGAVGTKTLRIKFGGTTLHTYAIPNINNLITTGETWIFNTTASAQDYHSFATYTSLSGATTCLTDRSTGTSAVDTTSAQDVVVTLQMADSGTDSSQDQSAFIEILDHA